MFVKATKDLWQQPGQGWCRGMEIALTPDEGRDLLHALRKVFEPRAGEFTSAQIALAERLHKHMKPVYNSNMIRTEPQPSAHDPAGADREFTVTLHDPSGKYLGRGEGTIKMIERSP